MINGLVAMTAERAKEEDRLRREKLKGKLKYQQPLKVSLNSAQSSLVPKALLHVEEKEEPGHSAHGFSLSLLFSQREPVVQGYTQSYSVQSISPV